MLIGTKPDSKGKEAALFRGRQITDFRWTPLADIPTYIKTVGKTKLTAGEEQTGMIYSSTEPTDKFIAENISFETLLSIIANPDSALYHKDLNGHSNSWPYFGIVCNSFVRYALNIKGRYPTRRWPDIPGMREIAAAESYTAEQIQLCDVLHVNGHVAMITDVLRDENGEIRQIEVSEGTRPTCKRRQYDLNEYFERYKRFALWRYDFVDQVPMPDEYQNACLERGVPGIPVIAVDCGNKSNYRLYEEVVISSFTDGENEIEVRRGEEVIETIAFTGRGKVSRHFDRGYYTLVHKSTGERVEFCVTDPEIRHKVENGIVTVWADACDPDSQISYMEFRCVAKGSGKVEEGKTFFSADCSALSKMEHLTEEEIKTGVITREIPSDAGNFKIYFENKYGIWTHLMIKL